MLILGLPKVASGLGLGLDMTGNSNIWFPIPQSVSFYSCPVLLQRSRQKSPSLYTTWRVPLKGSTIKNSNPMEVNWNGLNDSENLHLQALNCLNSRDETKLTGKPRACNHEMNVLTSVYVALRALTELKPNTVTSFAVRVLLPLSFWTPGIQPMCIYGPTNLLTATWSAFLFFSLCPLTTIVGADGHSLWATVCWRVYWGVFSGSGTICFL